MANQEHLDILKQGVETWNKWTEEHLDIRPDLRGAELRGADLKEANLNKVDLSSAGLSGANLSRANLSEADLSRADLHDAILGQANLSDADLSDASLSFANLSGANLSGANLSIADLDSTNLSEAILTRAILTRAYLSEPNLGEADLREATLSEAILTRANLSSANLSSAILTRAYLGQANLSQAILSRAYLDVAFLDEADLSRANLSQANLSRAYLNRTNLTRADLSEADLSQAILNGTNLSGANLSRAVVGLTVFGDVDLSVVKELETVRHSGPSTIGIDTIYRSKGNIPEVFLKGAGVDDTFITYIHSLVGRAIEYYSCFISYSSKDEAFAKRLYADLQSQNVRCWFAPEDLKWGERIRSGIDEAIRLHDKLLLILSKHSVASGWVEHEVKTALAKERKEKRTVLFPVRLDKAVLESPLSWATEIRHERNIGDFTRWKTHDAYEKAFTRLLRDLKAEAQKTGSRDGD